jgi:hypothetical protein
MALTELFSEKADSDDKISLATALILYIPCAKL